MTGGWDHYFLFFKLTGKSGEEGKNAGLRSGPNRDSQAATIGCNLCDLDFFFISHKIKINILTCRLVGINCNDTVKALGGVSWE